MHKNKNKYNPDHDPIEVYDAYMCLRAGERLGEGLAELLDIQREIAQMRRGIYDVEDPAHRSIILHDYVGVTGDKQRKGLRARAEERLAELLKWRDDRVKKLRAKS